MSCPFTLVCILLPYPPTIYTNITWTRNTKSMAAWQTMNSIASHSNLRHKHDGSYFRKIPSQTTERVRVTVLRFNVYVGGYTRCVFSVWIMFPVSIYSLTFCIYFLGPDKRHNEPQKQYIRNAHLVMHSDRRLWPVLLCPPER